MFAMAEDLDLRLVNKRVLESLVKAGSFDEVGREDTRQADAPAAAIRARLLASVDRILEHGSRAQRDREKGQSQLFGADVIGSEQGAGFRSWTPRHSPSRSSWPSSRRRWDST
jgi:DNA polymerase-3 subunit alpha